MNTNGLTSTEQNHEITFYLTGNTYPVKDLLKSNGMKFDHLFDGTPIWYLQTTIAGMQQTQFLAGHLDGIEVHVTDRIEF